MSNGEDSWDSEEMRNNDRLEKLCGSVDRAFRLLNIWVTTRQDCNGWRYVLGAKDNTVPTFKKRATTQGYSTEAIDLFLVIQGNRW